MTELGPYFRGAVLDTLLKADKAGVARGMLDKVIVGDDVSVVISPEYLQKVEEIVQLPDSDDRKKQAYLKAKGLIRSQLGKERNREAYLKTSFDPKNPSIEHVQLAAGLLIEVDRAFDLMTSKYQMMGEQGGMMNPDLLAYMNAVNSRKLKANAGIKEYAGQSLDEKRERVHQFAINAFTEKHRQRIRDAMSLVGTMSGGAHDWIKDALPAMQKVTESAEGRMAALDGEGAAGATLKAALEGVDAETLVTAWRKGVHLFMKDKDTGIFYTRELFWGVLEAMDAEAGNVGRQLEGGDKKFLKEWGQVIEVLYPDYHEALNTPEDRLTDEQKATLQKYAKQPVLLSETDDFMLTNGQIAKKGLPIFAFMVELGSAAGRRGQLNLKSSPLMLIDYEQSPQVRITSEAVRFGDPYFMRAYADVLTENYPELAAVMAKDKTTWEEDDQKLFDKYAKSVMWMSDHDFRLNNGTILPAGSPIFTFMVESGVQPNQTAGLSGLQRLERRVVERVLVDDEPLVPRRLNMGEKVRTMHPTDFRHDAALEWPTPWLEEQGIDPEEIVGAIPYFHDQMLSQMGAESMEYGLFQEFEARHLVREDVVVQVGDNEKKFKMHPHFEDMTEEQRSVHMQIELFAARYGMDWGLANGIKVLTQFIHREDPTLLKAGQLLSQGDIYSQLARVYKWLYKIGEAYQRDIALELYPSTFGRKPGLWHVIRALEGGGTRLKLYDKRFGVTILNGSDREVTLFDGSKTFLPKETLGGIRFPADLRVSQLEDQIGNAASGADVSALKKEVEIEQSDKEWQKAIVKHVLFAFRGDRLDGTARANAMRIVETARRGLEVYDKADDLSGGLMSVANKLSEIKDVAWIGEVKMIIDETHSGAMEPRTRQEAFEVLLGMPESMRQKLEGVDFTEYLTSIGADMDVDSIHNVGFLGLMRVVERHSFMGFDWGDNRDLFMKQAKYEMASERGYKASITLSTAMIQALDPHIEKFFASGFKPADMADLMHSTAETIWSTLFKDVQPDGQVAGKWGHELADALVEYASTYTYMDGHNARKIIAEMTKHVLKIINGGYGLAAYKIQDKYRFIVDKDGVAHRKAMHIGTSAGSGGEKIALDYFRGGKARKFADRMAAQFARRAGLRVLDPAGSGMKLVGRDGVPIPEHEKYLRNHSEKHQVVAGDGNMLLVEDYDLPKPTIDNFEWTTDGRREVGDVLKDVYHSHKIGVLFRELMIVHFLESNLRDKGVITTHENINPAVRTIRKSELTDVDLEFISRIQNEMESSPEGSTKRKLYSGWLGNIMQRIKD